MSRRVDQQLVARAAELVLGGSVISAAVREVGISRSTYYRYGIKMRDARAPIRQRVYDLYRSGYTLDDIAEMTGLKRANAYYWIRKFRNKEGGR
ncbi:hypothetical protein [Thermogutta sp.]|uniref:terminase gpP N-terminus-related DNA-binding protein n=1 Tax=Thermogutta sp. TaxID=1962930 RepID=UPI0032207C84